MGELTGADLNKVARAAFSPTMLASAPESITKAERLGGEVGVTVETP